MSQQDETQKNNLPTLDQYDRARREQEAKTMADTERQPTCEERIDDYYKRTFEEIHRLTGREEITRADLEELGADIDEYLNPDHDPDDPDEPEVDQEEARRVLRETWEQDILSIDREKKIRVCFSWGGPADYIDIYITDDGDPPEITRAVYLFQDWFDGAEREIRGDDLEAVISLFSYLAHE